MQTETKVQSSSSNTPAIESSKILTQFDIADDAHGPDTTHHSGISRAIAVNMARQRLTFTGGHSASTQDQTLA